MNSVEAGSNSALKKVMAMADSQQRGEDENRRLKEELRESKNAHDADKRQHQESVRGAAEAVEKRVAELMAKHETDVEAMNRGIQEHRLRSERAVTEMRELLDSRSSRPYLRFADLRDDPLVRGKAAALTGFASADAAVACWELLNHDGAAVRMKMWKSCFSVAPDLAVVAVVPAGPTALAVSAAPCCPCGCCPGPTESTQVELKSGIV